MIYINCAYIKKSDYCSGSGFDSQVEGIILKKVSFILIPAVYGNVYFTE